MITLLSRVLFDRSSIEIKDFLLDVKSNDKNGKRKLIALKGESYEHYKRKYFVTNHIVSL